MKFGKRLASEAARRFHESYTDYRALKHAIKEDVALSDAQGNHFQRALVAELQKVSAFYSRQAARLEAEFSWCVDGANSVQQLQELRAEVQELIKFVALNYLAVVKIIKKRNRHLQENFGAAANTSLHALDLLMGEVFFTSPRLANLATQAEVLSRDLQACQPAPSPSAPSPSTSSSTPLAATAPIGAGATAVPETVAAMCHAQQRQQLLEEYQCPVCLDTLHNPVVLTCAHRFCWGCLVAHCTACRDAVLPPLGSAGTDPAPAAPEEQQRGVDHDAQLSPAQHTKQSKSSSGGAQGTPALSTSPTFTYRLLEHLAADHHDTKAPQFYPCPVCRKPQILDIDTLQVDLYLDQFINNLQDMSNVSISAPHKPDTTTTTMTEEPHDGERAVQHLVLKRSASPEVPLVPEPWGIIRPQAPEHRGKLCVFLDLDGTLVSSFTPKRAPRLPAYVNTHIVGMGSKLNPQGVFVVERPGLSEFLEQLIEIAEVIIFTAGLEDYAKPIIDAIDPHGRLFTARIYREGTLRTEHYQCVKDMARVNRDLARTVLVDDTPLAFLHQPDNGVPILGFRGDPDDRLLLEAVLPLLQALAMEQDVQPVLRRRFDMANWFRRHGFPVDAIVRQALVDAAAERDQHMAETLEQAQGRKAGSLKIRQPAHTSSSLATAATSATTRQPTCLLPLLPPSAPPTRDLLFLADFDRTLVNFDCGERLLEQLAPELLPMLMGAADADPTASPLPLANTLLAELHRRGVSRDQLLGTLQQLGVAELPAATAATLHALRQAGADVAVLAGGGCANSVFVSHVLAGARLGGLVGEVLACPAVFEQPTQGNADAAGGHQLQQHLGHSVGAAAAEGGSGSGGGGAGSPGHKLVVRPWHGKGGPWPAHSCSLCPGSMCKGREVRAVRQAGVHRRIVFAGDGADDVCAALCLGEHDMVLARTSCPLARYLERASAGEPGTLPVQAPWRVWRSHEELHEQVLSLL